jgi:hypothetical protein
MKTTDGGLNWQTISPDLTGAKPQSNNGVANPTNDNATALGFGVVYSIAPSPLNANVIWAASDTGLIHLTQDGGKTWANVTPPGLRDWSRVSMMEASHFNAGEAYAAVDRHRLDDERPYFYRTHDFGKSWQSISAGIAEHAFARSIREDLRKQGLLFAGTEIGVYFSTDDGDRWQPLQLNLPVTPVYDLHIHGDDLIVATHGRGFWVLDDIAPLRQTAPATAFLYEPAAAVRVDNDSFLGTPLPPEEPQAKNPPDGAILDYMLSSGARNVTLEIYSSQQLVRRYSSAMKEEKKHPPLPIAERWFPEPQRLETTAGPHRFVWDLRWSNSGDAVDEEDDFAAPKGPRVVPGTYTVKLTVDGQPLEQKTVFVTMDPRSSATAADLSEQQRWAREMFAESMLTRKAVSETGSIKKQLGDLRAKQSANPGLLAKLDAFLAALQQVTAGDKQTMGFDGANTGVLAALRVVESGHRKVPSQAIEIYRTSVEAFDARLAQWQELKASGLPELNRALEQDGAAPLNISEIEEEIDYLMTR